MALNRKFTNECEGLSSTLRGICEHARVARVYSLRDTSQKCVNLAMCASNVACASDVASATHVLSATEMTCAAKD